MPTLVNSLLNVDIEIKSNNLLNWNVVSLLNMMINLRFWMMKKKWIREKNSFFELKTRRWNLLLFCLNYNKKFLPAGLVISEQKHIYKSERERITHDTFSSVLLFIFSSIQSIRHWKMSFFWMKKILAQSFFFLDLFSLFYFSVLLFI